MKCMKCNREIEKDDNFCHHCGHWTPRGYTYFNDNKKNQELLNGNGRKLENKFP